MDDRRLREVACLANRRLVEAGLVVLAFGNASAVDRRAGIMAIKPSGAKYSTLTPGDMVLIWLETGGVLDSPLRPSSDAATHLELYRAFPSVGGIVHTHSSYATAWAQAGRELPCLGTTHADHFRGAVPVTRNLTGDETDGEYERNTGRVIVERFGAGLDPDETPAVLVSSHGPFVWGPDVMAAVDNAIAIEHIAAIATHQAAIGGLKPLADRLRDRHYLRKHGAAAFYGQAVTALPASPGVKPEPSARPAGGAR
jgi:L-ribulose-5-phosphate 4-epimerase